MTEIEDIKRPVGYFQKVNRIVGYLTYPDIQYGGFVKDLRTNKYVLLSLDYYNPFTAKEQCIAKAEGLNEKFGEKVYDSTRVMVKRRYIHPDVKAEYKLWKRINLKDYKKSCRRIKEEEK